MAREKRGPMALEEWARQLTDGYPGVTIRNMTTSWRNGLAFCALIHRFRPDLIEFDKLEPSDIVGNCSLAFEVAESKLGIPALLDPEDMVAHEVPDRLSVLTYVAQFYSTFKNAEKKSPFSPRRPKESESRSPEKETSDKESRAGKRDLGEMSDRELIESESKRHLTRPVLLSTSSLCAICQNPVFISERVLFAKKLFHRSCFRCFNCGCVLNPHTADMSSEGLLMCLESLCQAEFHKRSHSPSINNDPDTQNEPIEDSSLGTVSTTSLPFSDINKEVNNNPFDEDEENEVNEIVNEGSDQIVNEIKDEIKNEEINDQKIVEITEEKNEEIEVRGNEGIEIGKNEEIEIKKNEEVGENELKEDEEICEGNKVESDNSLSTVPSKLEFERGEEESKESCNDEPVDSLVNHTEDKPKPNAIQLWINKDYYPAELNPFESEETLRVQERAASSESIGKNPFENDEDEPEESHNLPSRTIPKSHIPTPAKRTLEANLGDPNNPKPKPRKSPAPPPPTFNSRNNAANFSVPPPELKPIPKSPISILKAVPSKKFDNPPPLSPESSEILAKRPVPSPRSKRRAPKAPQVPAESVPVPMERNSTVSVPERTKPRSRSSSPATNSQRSSSKSPPRNLENTRIRTPRSPSPKPRNVSPKNMKEKEDAKQKVIKPPPGLMKGLKNHESNSSLGKYRKKRRAPPPRRKVEPLPEDAIKRELADLEVKERELERQGITLEGNIRKFMNNVEDPDEEQGEEETEQLDKMMIQLWSVVNEKNDILRRQTELEYLRRGHRLEEMQAELEFQVRVLMNTPLQDRAEDHATVEQMLIHRMLKLVDERNEVVEWLDYHRQVEREEELRISQSFGSFSLRPSSRTGSRSRSRSPGPIAPPVPPDSGKKSKKNKEKKEKKSVKIKFFGKKKRKGSKGLTDEDKDKDESEV